MLRAAVERNFEIIGEALSQAQRFFPKIVGQITNEQEIISFRNRLIHGYATVKNALVWDIVQANLPRFRQEVVELLMQPEDQSKG